MRVVVGRVGRAHGVRGEVAVDVRTDDPDVRFAPGSVLFTAAEGPSALTVQASRWHSGRLMVAFAGARDRDDAQALSGVVLYRDEDDRVAEPQAWYDYDLIGCAVRTEAGVVGSVVDVMHPPAQDLLVVELSDGSTRLVPLVEQIVPEVDVEARAITVADRPGLLFDAPDEGD